MSPDTVKLVAKLDAEFRPYDLRGVLNIRDIQALRERNAARQRATLEDMRARGVSLLCERVERKSS